MVFLSIVWKSMYIMGNLYYLYLHIIKINSEGNKLHLLSDTALVLIYFLGNNFLISNSFALSLMCAPSHCHSKTVHVLVGYTCSVIITVMMICTFQIMQGVLYNAGILYVLVWCSTAFEYKFYCNFVSVLHGRTKHMCLLKNVYLHFYV